MSEGREELLPTAGYKNTMSLETEQPSLDVTGKQALVLLKSAYT